MTTVKTQSEKPLRLWPGVAILALQWLARFVVPAFAPEATEFGAQAGLLGGAAILLWWLFLSRAPWRERLGGLAVILAALAVTPVVLHESVAKGAMGFLFYLYVAPVLSLALVVWAAASRHLAPGPRWATMVAAVLVACGMWAFVRTGGITGNLDSDFAWRWSPTPEEELLAHAGEAPDPPVPMAAPAAAPAVVKEAEAPDTEEPEPGAAAAEEPAAAEPAEEPAAAEPTAAEPAVETAIGTPAGAAPAPAVPEWPGFRGPGRDGDVPGVKIATDWTASPPAELWRRPVGPGWSSFAVSGDRVYTQEQRGDDEVVSCYRTSTGEPLWQHRDAVRFWESNAGAGPRGTPTLDDGIVYTLGATGIVNALDADSGAVRWSRDAAADTGAKVPTWGFSSSPLVLGDRVVVAAGGRLIAYEVVSGEPRWQRVTSGGSYSSPHLETFDGVAQVLLLAGKGVTSIAPADGAVLWEYAGQGGSRIVQPAMAAPGELLIGASEEGGLRRLAVSQGADGWSLEERWTSNGLKPYFSDLVVHEGHAYGFDGAILSCVDLEDGERKWKGGRYGHGQLVLLPDQDLALVLSEKGELVLVAATPEGFRELARHPAIEGKTWNHPVLVGDLLLVRNDREMAAFRLAGV